MNKIIKSFKASGAIADHRKVVFTATAGVVAQAAGPTGKIAGVTDHPGGAADGETIDVVMFGLTELDAGGTFAAGDNIVSDGSGKGVIAAPAGGVNNVVGARAVYPAVNGDRVLVFVNPSNLQG